MVRSVFLKEIVCVENINQVAKIEQAIEKRWGKEAVENPATHWDEEKEKELRVAT